MDKKKDLNKSTLSSGKEYELESGNRPVDLSGTHYEHLDEEGRYVVDKERRNLWPRRDRDWPRRKLASVGHKERRKVFPRRATDRLGMAKEYKQSSIVWSGSGQDAPPPSYTPELIKADPPGSGQLVQPEPGRGAPVHVWDHSQGMHCRCRTCAFYVSKVLTSLGRCRRRAPTLKGWPVVWWDDRCGDYKPDEAKV